MKKKITKKELTKTLLSIGLCSSIIVSCTKNSNIDDEKKQLSTKTEQVKNEIVKYKSLQKQLEEQISQNKKMVQSNQALRNDLLQKEQSFSKEREKRELELESLISRLQEVNKSITQAEKRHANLKNIMAQETKDLDAAKAALSLEREKLQQQVADERSAFETEMENKKSIYEANKEERETELDARVAKHKKAIASLENQLTDVVQREKKVVSQQEELRQAQDTLRVDQNNLKQEKEDHLIAAENFSKKIQAARELFIKNDKGDVFNKINSDDVFSFRMSLWGYGSVKNIQEIRRLVEEYNKENGIADNNKHRKYAPVLMKTKEPLAAEVTGALKTTAERFIKVKSKNFIFLEDSDVTSVNDTFIVTGKATDIKEFRNEMNQLLESRSKSGDIMATNMWFVARPVQEVRVNMKINIMGSSSMSHDRDIESILVMSKIRPLKSSVENLKNIDLANPSQYIFGDSSSASCETVGLECLIELKKLGLLNHETQMNYVDSTGERVTGKLTYFNYLVKMLEVSVAKLRLQGVLRSAQQGVTVNQNVTYRSVGVWESLFDLKFSDAFESYQNDGIVIDIEGGGSVEKLRQNRELLSALAKAPIVEKIEISYEVSMVDVINEEDGSLDMSQYFNSGSIGNKELGYRDILKRGELEIPLPISFEESSTRSDFVDLSLTDFKPALLKPEDLPARDAYPYTKESLKDSSKYAVYKKASDAHKVAMEKYEGSLEKSKQGEYDNRSLDHLSDLRSLLKKLKK